MKKCLFITFILPLFMLAQKNSALDSLFSHIPINDGKIIYEKVIVLDSTHNKDQIFNAVKSVLIRFSEYKFATVDEDRLSGSITSRLGFPISVKTTLFRVVYSCTSRFQVDVKESRFRIRIYDNKASLIVMNTPVEILMENAYFDELKKHKEGKLKIEKSVIEQWDYMLFNIIESFSELVQKNLQKDDF